MAPLVYSVIEYEENKASMKTIVCYGV